MTPLLIIYELGNRVLLDLLRENTGSPAWNTAAIIQRAQETP